MEKPSDFPPLWCDFNACGLSGRQDDNCYYSLDKVRVKKFKAGDRVFYMTRILWMARWESSGLTES
jgi:hypothetical protein